MAERGPRAFVIGHPIAHSRSPIIHSYWLNALGIAGSYERIDIAPDGFSGFIANMPASGFVGGNVTIPHKEAAHALVARRDEAAELIGAVNTLWFEDGELIGGNTDAYGFAANLDAGAPHWREADSALVLGAGGASRAVLFALRQAGIADIRLANRTRERAVALSARFDAGVTVCDWNSVTEAATDAALVVNTTALGMGGGGDLPLEASHLPPYAIVTDIVYTPLLTPLLKMGRRRGCKIVDGLGMLLHQAVPGFERWFGVRPDVTPQLHALVTADLEAHA